MKIQFSGLIGLVIAWLILTVPIWLGAKTVGASNATIPHASGALALAMILSAFAGLLTDGIGLLATPLIFIGSFAFVLRTSFFSSIIISVLAIAGYAFISKVTGGILTV